MTVYDRIKPVRHSDSPEAASIRRNLEKIEGKSQRALTGLNADPNFMVTYDSHPFEKKRNLQGESLDKFKPMRIRFETGALDDMRDSTNAMKIDFIKNEILDRTAQFWSNALVSSVLGLLPGD